MSARQPSNRPSKKPALTTTRYKQMLRELKHLHKKYGGDLEVIVPEISQDLERAAHRSKQMGVSPAAGAPKLWNNGSLVRVWLFVRALMKEKPGRTEAEACELLCSEGFEVWAHEPRSVRVNADASTDDVSKYITNPAESSLRDHEYVKNDLEQDVLKLVERRKGRATTLD